MSDSNKYKSVLRSFMTRNFYEDTLTPGTDIVVPVTPYPISIKDFCLYASKETNFMIRRVGIFSNFADGLVFKTPANRLDVLYEYNAYRYDGPQFNLAFTYGSKNVTLNSGTTGWIAGTLYPVAVQIDAPDRYMIVNVLASAANAGDIQDYWDTYTAGHVSFNLDAAPSVPFSVKNISQLNCMHEMNDLAQPFNFSSGQEYDLAGIELKINRDTFGQTHNTEFLTNTIDDSYTDETVYFDVMTEIEFTQL